MYGPKIRDGEPAAADLPHRLHRRRDAGRAVRGLRASRRAPSPTCRCSSRRCAGAASPSASTSTTARRFARNSSRSSAPSSASRSSTPSRTRRRARARWSAGFAPSACSSCRCSRREQLDSLDAMNRALAAWVEGEYHHAPHRGLGDETPADKWARTSEGVRMPDAERRRPLPRRAEAPRAEGPHRHARRRRLRGRRRARRRARHAALRPARKPPTSARSRSGIRAGASRSRGASTCSPTASSSATTPRASIQLPKTRADDDVPEGLAHARARRPVDDLDDEELF